MFRRSSFVLVALLASTLPAVAQQKVEIKRVRVKTIDPARYRVTIQLEPAEVVDLVAPSAGYLRAVLAEAGGKVNKEAEVARLENDELRLEFERAKALVRVAEADLELAKADTGAQQPQTLARAQASIEAAEATRDLAELRYNRSTVRSPITGIVLETAARPGRFLRPGDPIAMVGNVERLRVELPMLRSEAAEGKQVDVQVEDQTVRGKIVRVQPLSSRFDALRDLVNDAVVAVVEFDNAAGKHAVGQTVSSPLVPREPIALLPNSAIGNLPEGGGRRLQVIRDDVVRDVPVTLLAGVGEDRSYVTGTILETDEVITEASIDLVAGTPVRRQADAQTQTTPPARPKFVVPD